MDSINFVVLGEQTIATDFGKKGTVTDLTLYDKKESNAIRTWVIPNGFPDKIQPLFQAINLAEYVIFYVGSLDKFTGEQIIALDILKKREGIISHTYDVDENRLNAMIKGTVLERYKKIPSEKIIHELNTFPPIIKKGKTKIVIDHCFDVQGVGTVVLGKVYSGSVKQYDDLILLPSNNRVMVKSIQMHDDNVKEATCPARVGLALKGIKSDKIRRGDILVHDNDNDNDIQNTSSTIFSEMELDFNKNPFYKDKIIENQTCLLNIGLQIKPAKFSLIDQQTNKIKITLEKPIIYDSLYECVLLKPESSTIRIMGNASLCH